MYVQKEINTIPRQSYIEMAALKENVYCRLIDILSSCSRQSCSSVQKCLKSQKCIFCEKVNCLHDDSYSEGGFCCAVREVQASVMSSQFLHVVS